jgi:restriction system protein
MWPALVAMKELGGSATHEELLEKLIEIERIPEAVQNVMHTERQTKLSYTSRGRRPILEKPALSRTLLTVFGRSQNLEGHSRLLK